MRILCNLNADLCCLSFKTSCICLTAPIQTMEPLTFIHATWVLNSCSEEQQGGEVNRLQPLAIDHQLSQIKAKVCGTLVVAIVSHLQWFSHVAVISQTPRAVGDLIQMFALVHSSNSFIEEHNKLWKTSWIILNARKRSGAGLQQWEGVSYMYHLKSCVTPSHNSIPFRDCLQNKWPVMLSHTKCH